MGRPRASLIDEPRSWDARRRAPVVLLCRCFRPGASKGSLSRHSARRGATCESEHSNQTSSRSEIRTDNPRGQPRTLMSCSLCRQSEPGMRFSEASSGQGRCLQFASRNRQRAFGLSSAILDSGVSLRYGRSTQGPSTTKMTIIGTSRPSIFSTSSCSSLRPLTIGIGI